jgi:hypothetical protein
LKKIFLSKTFDHPTVYNSIGLQSSFIYADTFSGLVRLQIGIGYDPETFLKIRNSNLEKSFSMEIAYLQHICRGTELHVTAIFARITYLAHMFLISNMLKSWHKFNSWQGIKGFDKSDFPEVLSTYYKLPSQKNASRICRGGGYCVQTDNQRRAFSKHIIVEKNCQLSIHLFFRSSLPSEYGWMR